MQFGGLKGWDLGDLGISGQGFEIWGQSFGIWEAGILDLGVWDLEPRLWGQGSTI